MYFVTHRHLVFNLLQSILSVSYTHLLAASYYNTNSARAAFYPQITLSGSAGWTNSAGSAIVNPGKLLASAIGSLTQPLFYRGANIARLKQAKAQEEQSKIQFQTTLLKAGNEVSNALYQYQMTSEKAISREIQVNSARKAAEDTKELFNLGTSTSVSYTHLDVYKRQVQGAHSL